MLAATTTTDPAPPVAGAYRSPEAACSLSEVLDRILHLGVSLEGNLTITLANVDLLYLDLRLLLAAVDTVWPDGRPSFSAAPQSDQAPPPPRPLPPPTSSDERVRPGPAAVAPSEAAARAMTQTAPATAPSSPAAGLVRLVLTLVKVLHELLERQAVRRMDGGHLTAVQIDARLSRQAGEQTAALAAMDQRLGRIEQALGTGAVAAVEQREHV